MQHLAEQCKRLHYRPEQVQDFTPTPMTLATTMFYTGLNPYTMQPIFVARTKEEKQKQNSFFFWWKSNTKVFQNTNYKKVQKTNTKHTKQN